MDLLTRNIGYLLGALLFFVSLYSYATTPIICNQPYALCTSAKCIPLPNNPNEAICECVTETGPSIGFSACDKRKPTYTKYKTLILISTFSFAQFATKKSMTCPQGMPWSNCVDMPCMVDPQNKKRALCQCKIDSAQPFFTFGGSCDTNTCANGFWSGATSELSQVLRTTLLRVVKSNIKPELCKSRSMDKDVGQ